MDCEDEGRAAGGRARGEQLINGSGHQRRQHRHEEPADRTQARVQRDAERDGRGSEQEMHELGPLKVGVVRGVGRDQQRDQCDHGNAHGTDQRIAPAALVQPMGHDIGPQGRREP